MKTSILLVSCILFGTQTAPPRDKPATQAAGTAVVRGRITSAATGEPLHRVRVTLNGQTPTPPTAVTDTRGEFEITNVAAGSYSLTATRAGYLSLQYGQRRPREAGRTLELSAGQILEQINMALPRGSVLAGVVTDDTGDHYPAVRVEAVELRYIRGRRMPVQATSTLTNDLGQFRLSGLQPGTYFLRASTTDTWEGDDGKGTHAYAPTYFPGVTAFNEAQSLSVGIGQQMPSLDFSLRPGRAALITGVMQNANGEAMASQTINLSIATRGVGGALFSTGGGGSARTDANGSFEFANLAPGEYVLSSGGDAERVSLSVTVADGDVRSVVLMPLKPSIVRGTIVTDDGSVPPFLPGRLRVTPIAADPEALLPSFTGPGASDIGRDWSFRIFNISGNYLFRITGLPAEWMLGAVLLKGRNFADLALNVPPGIAETSGVEIVLTRKGGRIGGQVVDSEGAPAPDSTVVVFAAAPARWTIASRFVRAVRPDNAGKFSIAGLPPATYHAIAQDFVADGQWEDPDFLNALRPRALRLEVREAAAETVTLKLERPR